MDIIRSPAEWGFAQLRNLAGYTTSVAQTLASREEAQAAPPPTIHRIGVGDLREALAQGFHDFEAARSDVLMLAFVYPVCGLLLWWLAASHDLLPIIVPLVTGFALLGPVAAVGLYEMSRQREAGRDISWSSAFEVVKSPAFGSIVVLGLALLAIFLIWLGVAQTIYSAFLGAEPPKSVSMLLHDVLTTRVGWAMAACGIGVGFLFAALVLSISAVSFPMLLDRNVGPGTAVVTSLRTILANPRVMAIWGLIVAVSLFAASIPALLGLIVVVPVLGHATWHLYRKLVTF